MAGVSPRRIVISFSAAVSVAIVYLLSDGLAAVYVERRHLTATLAPSGASSIFPQDTTAYREFSTVAQERLVSDFDSSPSERLPLDHKVDYYDREYSHSVMEPSLTAEEDGEVLEEGEDDKIEENKVDEVEDNKEEGIIEEITPVGITDKDSDFSTIEQSSVMFSIRKGFNFPHPQVFKPTQKILSANWVHELKDYLHSIHPARSLTITVATKSFIPNLLNWLIAAYRLAEPPMDHVLVLAFDKAVFSLLSARKIPCVYVPYSSVLKKLKKGVSTVWMTRLAVIRLLNHWGYDVLQLDTDAVPLRNPHLLFDGYSDYDLVGARGVLPFELGHGPWGFTLCMGAALLRGTQRMGEPLYKKSLYSLSPEPQWHIFNMDISFY